MSPKKSLSYNFDVLVDQHNTWLNTYNDPEAMKEFKRKAFLDGFFSVFGFNKSLMQKRCEPILYRNDLNDNQKYAIRQGASWKRVEMSLEKEVLSVEEVEQKKQIVDGMYYSYKKIYQNNFK